MFKETPKKIISLQNPLVKHLAKLRIDPNYRQEQGSVLIAGHKLVNEISSHTPPKRLFSVDPSPHTIVSESVMKKITGLTSPEGIAAEFPLPSPQSLIGKGPILALDNLNDPGNVGALIRTALALGWEGVFFLPGCVDPFHEKVLRASRGALFRLPWHKGNWDDLQQLNLKIYVADLGGRPLTDISPQKDFILLMSNEAQGVSDLGAQIGERVTIPMPGEMESLNVAISGAIMMYMLGAKS